MIKSVKITVVCIILMGLGFSKSTASDLDKVICNAMKGRQAQEEKKIPYNIGNYKLIELTVDCKNRALITKKKHSEYNIFEFPNDFEVKARQNWRDANCSNLIFNTNTGWSTTQIITDVEKKVVLKLEANFEICSRYNSKE